MSIPPERKAKMTHYLQPHQSTSKTPDYRKAKRYRCGQFSKLAKAVLPKKLGCTDKVG
jgi:hypothetical protein